MSHSPEEFSRSRSGRVTVSCVLCAVQVNMINMTLGPYLLPNNPTNTLPTIGDMVSSGHRALMTLQVLFCWISTLGLR